MSADLHGESEFDLQVLSRTQEAEGVTSLLLGRPDGGSLPQWNAGSHIDVTVDGMTRQYSLTGARSDRSTWQIAVLREDEGRGCSRAIVDTLHEGAVVPIRGPRNHFAFESSPRYLFIAGGIGITPIRAMIREAEAAGSEWQLLYVGRSEKTMAFVQELRSCYGARAIIRPKDEFGTVDLPAFLDSLTDDTLVYCCGPERLLASVEQVCADGRAGSLRVERFLPRTDLDHLPDTEFEVELVQTGVTVRVPIGISILSAAEDAGAFVTSSCEEGTCGSCETRVLAGVPDHRDSVLNAESRALNDTMMICVSRCIGARLVLDL